MDKTDKEFFSFAVICLVAVFLILAIAYTFSYFNSAHAQVLDPLPSSTDPIASDTTPVVVSSSLPVIVPIDIFNADPSKLYNADLRVVVSGLRKVVNDTDSLASKYAALYDSCKH